MMRKGMKAAALVLAFSLCLGLTGCGGKEAQETKAGQEGTDEASAPKGILYDAEYTRIENDLMYTSYPVIGETDIYFVGTDLSSAGDTVSGIYRYDINTGKTENIPAEFNEGAYIQGMALTPDGNLAMMISEMLDETRMSSSIRVIAKDGTVVLDKNVDDLTKDEEIPYLYNMAVGKDNMIYVNNGNGKVWALDKDGNLLFALPVEDWVESMGATADGTVYITSYSYETQKAVLKPIDVQKQDWGEELTDEAFSSGMVIMPSRDNNVLLKTASGLVSYNVSEKTASTVINWIDNDILADDVAAASQAADGTFRMFTAVGDSTGTSVVCETVLLTQREDQTPVEKQIISLGTVVASYGIRRGVVNFNRSSDKYRVELVEYNKGDMYDWEARQEATTRLANDITAGKAPDILNITDSTEQKFGIKGVLEDLKPYLDKDPQLKRSDFFENILDTYETNGKMFLLVPEFKISTVAGKISDVGEGMHWTLEDVIKLKESRPEAALFEYESNDLILTYCLNANIDSFFNIGEGLCDFDNEEFIKLLEFANTFPSSEKVQEAIAMQSQDNSDSYATKLNDGRLLLNNTTLSSIQQYQLDEGIFGEPFTYIGYPTKEGNGSVASSGDIGLAMNSKCPDKEGAWEFMRYFLTEDYQNNYVSGGFPIMKSAYQKTMEKAMKPIYGEDENGQQVEIATGMWGVGDFTVEIFAAKQEQVDQVTKLIESIDRADRSDDELFNIISEEVAAFFGGQKSAKEVAGVIQSRANIYMNENR